MRPLKRPLRPLALYLLTLCLLSILGVSPAPAVADQSQIVIDGLLAEADAVTLDIDVEGVDRTVGYAIWISGLPYDDPRTEQVAFFKRHAAWQRRVREIVAPLIRKHGTHASEVALREEAFAGALGQTAAQAQGYRRLRGAIGSEKIDGIPVHAFLLRRRVSHIAMRVAFEFAPQFSEGAIALNPRVRAINSGRRPADVSPEAWLVARKAGYKQAAARAKETLADMRARRLRIDGAVLDRIRSARGQKVRHTQSANFLCDIELVTVRVSLDAHDGDPESEPKRDEASKRDSKPVASATQPSDVLGPWPADSKRHAFTASRRRLMLAFVAEASKRMEWFEDEYAFLALKAQEIRLREGTREQFIFYMRKARSAIEEYRTRAARRLRLWNDPATLRAAILRDGRSVTFATPRLESLTRSDLRMAMESCLARLWSVLDHLAVEQFTRAKDPLQEAVHENWWAYADAERELKDAQRRVSFQGHSHREAALLADQGLRRPITEAIAAYTARAERYGLFLSEWIAFGLPSKLPDAARAWLSASEQRTYVERARTERAELAGTFLDVLQVWIAQEPRQDRNRRSMDYGRELSIVGWLPSNAESPARVDDHRTYRALLAKRGIRPASDIEAAAIERLERPGFGALVAAGRQKR